MSVGKIFSNSKKISDWTSNSFKILCLSLLSASLTKIRSKLKTLSCQLHFSGAQGRVSPKLIVRPGQNSNSYETLHLCWLPASSMKIQSKMKALSRLRQIWPEFELIRDFMPILFTCKRDADPITHEAAIVSTTFSPFKSMETVLSLTKANSLKWPKIEPFRGFMPILSTCKFEEDPIKNEGAIMFTTVSPL